MQAHGNATAYAFMLDADFVVKEPWRLRITAQRMVAECGERSVEECGKGMKVLLLPPLAKTLGWVQSSRPAHKTPFCMTAQACLSILPSQVGSMTGRQGMHEGHRRVLEHNPALCKMAYSIMHLPVLYQPSPSGYHDMLFQNLATF